MSGLAPGSILEWDEQDGAVIVRRSGRFSSLEIHEALFSKAPSTPVDEDVVTAALAHYRSQSRVEFSDCLVLEIACKAGHTPLGTFDRDVARLPSAQQLR